MHQYKVEIEWLGNTGSGTSGYRSYGRQLSVRAANKHHEILASADPTFHGDRERWNPEELLLTAVAQCHMLSYLHMAVRAGVVVVSYTDTPIGAMEQEGLGGRFTEIMLYPVVTVADPAMAADALAAHEEAAKHCFIASSVNFPVLHAPTIRVTERICEL